MAAINRVPKGFLGILDAKTGGRTPAEPLGALAPTMDLTPNYLADIPLEVVQASTGAAVLALQFVAPVTVPAGELWYVYAVSVEIVGTAANWAVGVPALSGPTDGGVTNVSLAVPPIVETAPAGVVHQLITGVKFDSPLLLSSGSVLGLWATQQLGTGGSNGRTKVIFRKVTV